MSEAGTQARWRWARERASEADGDGAHEIARQLNLHPLAARLLVARGVTDPQRARDFLHPKLTSLTDPLEIPGIERAAGRIARAVHDAQPIIIYGDYDVDGITAAAVLWHMLKQLGANVQTYVPHRMEEGYGLNEQAIRGLASPPSPTAEPTKPPNTHGDARDEPPPLDGRREGRPLLVSVDCGITAVGPARAARDLGVDLIITDHHRFDPDDLPAAHTVVHPGLAQPPAGEEGLTPQADLCGAGVAFELAWQIARVCCGVGGPSSSSSSSAARAGEGEQQGERGGRGKGGGVCPARCASCWWTC